MASKVEKSYTEAEKAEILAVFVNNGKNVKKTCRDYVQSGGSLTPQTLRRWWKAFEKNPEDYPVIADVIQTSTEEFIERTTNIVNLGTEIVEQNLTRIRDNNVELSPADILKLQTATGIAVDKLRLSRGEATRRTESLNTVVAVTSEEIAASITASITSAITEGRKRDEEVIQIEAEIAEAELVDSDSF